jgi:hypothetical protein
MTLEELEQDHRTKTKQEQGKVIPDPCACKPGDIKSVHKVRQSEFGTDIVLVDTYQGLMYMKLTEDGSLIPLEESW